MLTWNNPQWKFRIDVDERLGLLMLLRECKDCHHESTFDGYQTLQELKFDVYTKLGEGCDHCIDLDFSTPPIIC